MGKEGREKGGLIALGRAGPETGAALHQARALGPAANAKARALLLLLLSSVHTVRIIRQVRRGGVAPDAACTIETRAFPAVRSRSMHVSRVVATFARYAPKFKLGRIPLNN